jgi:hypothetical protein
MYENNEGKIWAFIIIGGFVFLIGLFWTVPMYTRYQNLLNAKNELAQQQYLRQVSIATAEAKNESAKFEAQAEITRAEGVAKANQIIGESLQHNEAYLRYLWIQNMNEHDKTVIYIPTEANLPILEAGKR